MALALGVGGEAGLAPWPCQLATAWPERGSVLPLGVPVIPRFSLKAGGRRLEECGELCLTLNDGDALCRPAEDLTLRSVVELENLVPGYHRLRLRWKDQSALAEHGTETWFHVSTASELGDEARSDAARAHLVYWDRAGDSTHEEPVPFSVSQFDDTKELTALTMERFNIDRVNALPLEKEEEGPLGVRGSMLDGSEASKLVVLHMEMELIVRELMSVPADGADPAEIYFPIRTMWTVPGKFDERALDAIIGTRLSAPDPQATPVLHCILESAIAEVPGLALTAHTMLNVAWSLRDTGDEAAATAAVERAARATYYGILADMPRLRRRGDSRRPVGDVVLVTVASHGGPELESLRRSAQSIGLELTVGGMDRPWGGLSSKVAIVLEVIEGVDDNTLVLFVDAFDVLFLPPSNPEDIKHRYRMFGADIIFGGEKACAPDPGAIVLYPGHLVAANAFLNSGTYMGRASDVRLMLNEIMEDLRLHHGGPFGNDILKQNDQRWFTRYFLRHKGGSGAHADYAKFGAYGGDHVALDVRQALFLQLHDRDLSEVMLVTHAASTEAILHYLPTGTTPLLLHGNGNGLYLLGEIEKELAVLGWPPGLQVEAAATAQA